MIIVKLKNVTSNFSKSLSRKQEEPDYKFANLGEGELVQWCGVNITNPFISKDIWKICGVTLNEYDPSLEELSEYMGYERVLLDSMSKRTERTPREHFEDLLTIARAEKKIKEKILEINTKRRIRLSQDNTETIRAILNANTSKASAEDLEDFWNSFK